MNEIWKLLSDPTTDPAVLRVFRWLLQWPEALAKAVVLDRADAVRATGLTVEEVDYAIADIESRGCVRLEPDGTFYFAMMATPPAGPEPIPAPRPRIPREQTRTITLGLRWKVLERDKNRCQACGSTVEDGAKLVLDHIKPFSKGGLTVESNLQVLCRECNSGKYNRWTEIA